MSNTNHLTSYTIVFVHRLVLTIMCAFCLSACSFKEEQVGLNIVGYNHTTDRSIYHFSVNGSMGSGLGPGDGGGAFTCCVNVPKVWNPGVKVKIKWEYQGGDKLPPPPPDQEVEIDVPRYGPDDLSRFAVHFFPGNKVKVLVTMLSDRHPDYPPELRRKPPEAQ